MFSRPYATTASVLVPIRDVVTGEDGAVCLSYGIINVYTPARST